MVRTTWSWPLGSQPTLWDSENRRLQGDGERPSARLNTLPFDQCEVETVLLVVLSFLKTSRAGSSMTFLSSHVSLISGHSCSSSQMEIKGLTLQPDFRWSKKSKTGWTAFRVIYSQTQTSVWFPYYHQIWPVSDISLKYLSLPSLLDSCISYLVGLQL